MVLAGAFVGIASTWLFHTASFSMHIWLSVVFSILIALPVYIIVALDNPYRGQISVGPDPLERVHDQLMVANH
jgi:hypothetical protein